MDRLIFNKNKVNTLKTLLYVSRNFGILHHKNPYVKAILNSSTKCFQCRSEQVSQLANLKFTKQEWKAWKNILRSSNLLKKQPEVVSYSGGGILHSRGSNKQQQKPRENEEEEEMGKPGEGPPDGPFNPWAVMGALFGLFFWYMLYKLIFDRDRVQMTWTNFETTFLMKGQVEAMHVFKFTSGQYIEVELHPDSEYRKKTGKRRAVIDIVSNESVPEKLREFESKHNIPEHERLPVSFSKEPAYMQPLFTLLLFLAIMAVLSRGGRMRIDVNKQVENQFKKEMGGSSNMQDFSGRKRDIKDLVTFANIAGQKEAIVELKEFVDYVKRPLKYQKIGAKVPRGALLTGPPGCGKTLLAKALAGESNVPFYAKAGSEFIEIFGGLGASRIRELFQNARAKAPCIIYIDEIDTIGRKRGGGDKAMGGLSSETESTLNQLLVEMDGMSTTDGVIVLASTNRAEILDQALLRAGRFDRHILIDLPTLKEREELFHLYLKDIKTETSKLDVIVKRLSQITPGMSGADIANVCNEAAIHAARHQNTVVKESDLDYAVERVIEGSAKANKTMSMAEKNIVAYHEAGHVITKCLLEGADRLLKTSIVPRASEKLSFSRFIPSENKLQSREDLFTLMCVTLGGRVAENIVFNETTTAAEDDLKKVTKIAYSLIKTFGMSETLGNISFPTDEEVGSAFGKKPYSKMWKKLIDVEAKKIVAAAYKKTEILLQLERKKLDLIASELLEKESLTTSELQSLLGVEKAETPNPYKLPENLL